MPTAQLSRTIDLFLIKNSAERAKRHLNECIYLFYIDFRARQNDDPMKDAGKEAGSGRGVEVAPPKLGPDPATLDPDIVQAYRDFWNTHDVSIVCAVSMRRLIPSRSWTGTRSGGA